jgi:hypothetical protein
LRRLQSVQSVRGLQSVQSLRGLQSLQSLRRVQSLRLIAGADNVDLKGPSPAPAREAVFF